jgi:hypothetical protein
MSRYCRYKNKLDMLTQNSTVDELFGIENKLDKLAICKQEQFKPLTRDTIRLNLIAKIERVGRKWIYNYF